MTTNINDFDKESIQIIKQWFTIRSLTPSTREVYLSYISQFIEFNNTTLYNIYTTAIKEQLQDENIE